MALIRCTAVGYFANSNEKVKITPYVFLIFCFPPFLTDFWVMGRVHHWMSCQFLTGPSLWVWHLALKVFWHIPLLLEDLPCLGLKPRTLCFAAQVQTNWYHHPLCLYSVINRLLSVSYINKIWHTLTMHSWMLSVLIQDCSY